MTTRGRLMILSVTVIALCGGNFFMPQRFSVQASDQSSSPGTIRNLPTGHAEGGEALYNASCIVCHGPRATGGIGPRLADNPILANDQAFWKVVHEGRHMMPPQKGVVTDQQLADIRAWLKTLQ